MRLRTCLIDPVLPFTKTVQRLVGVIADGQRLLKAKETSVHTLSAETACPSLHNYGELLHSVC